MPTSEIRKKIISEPSSGDAKISPRKSSTSDRSSLYPPAMLTTAKMPTFIAAYAAV